MKFVNEVLHPESFGADLISMSIDQLLLIWNPNWKLSNF